MSDNKSRWYADISYVIRHSTCQVSCSTTTAQSCNGHKLNLDAFGEIRKVRTYPSIQISPSLKLYLT